MTQILCRFFSFRTWTFLGLLALGLPGYAGTEKAEKREKFLDEVKTLNFDQNVGAKLPLDLNFVDHRGQTRRLSEYFGESERPVVLIMGYNHCAVLCDLSLKAFAKKAGALLIKDKDNFKFKTLFVSIDDEETVEAARTKREGTLGPFPLDRRESWDFLTGQAEDIKTLADAVGFHYMKDPLTGEFAHPAGLAFITSDGVISSYLMGVDYREQDLRLSLVQASKGKLGSIKDQILLFCYHYDPKLGGFSLHASRVLNIFATITALLVIGTLIKVWKSERKGQQV